MGRRITLILIISCIILIAIIIDLVTRPTKDKKTSVHQPIQTQASEYRLPETTVKENLPPGPDIWLRTPYSSEREISKDISETEGKDKEEELRQPDIIEY